MFYILICTAKINMYVLNYSYKTETKSFSKWKYHLYRLCY